MADVPQQDDRTPDVQQPTQDNSSSTAIGDAAYQSWQDRDQTREAVTPGSATTSTTRPSDSPNQSTTSNTQTLSFDDVWAAGKEFTGWLASRMTGEAATCSLNPSEAKACCIKKDQANGLLGSINDVKPDQYQAKQTLTEKDGQLERVVTSKNKDGSSSTVKTREEYVRDEHGKIVEDENHVKQTRVLAEDKEAKDKDGKTTFSSHTDYKYNKDGDLESSKTDASRVGKDGKLHPINSFSVQNEYNEQHQLVHHHAAVLTADGKKELQNADYRYGYDEKGNRTSEEITRVRGNNEKSTEFRYHQYKDFGGHPELTRTSSHFMDNDGKETGRLETDYKRRENGSLEAERTNEYDQKGNVTHRFEAIYDKDEAREWSKDVHKTFHENGKEHTVTTSEFNRYSDSTANRVIKDAQGNITNEFGFAQKMDGSIVSSKKDSNGKEIELLNAEAGQALGNWEDRETAWNNLERLSGDSTNRDAMEGWKNLGAFAGGMGKQEDGIYKLMKWGQGDTSHGIDILSQNWGNGEGRAGQGIQTYLSMGDSAAVKEATEKGTEGLVAAQQALQNILNGEAGNSLTALKESVGKFGDALDALTHRHAHAERLREKIHKDPAKSGELVTHRGNGLCSNGVCEIKKDGDEGKHEEKPGEPDAMERGIDATLAWSKDGKDFEAGLRLRAEIAGGDMMKLGAITEQMGSTQTLGENGEVVTNVSRLRGNDSMLKLGTTESGRIDPEQAAEQFERAGVTPQGYDGMVAAQNFFEAGVSTPMKDGKPVLDAEGKPIYLHSGERGVESVIAIGQGNPVHGMDAMTTLSTKTDATGNTTVDMRVGFSELPKIGETLTVVDGKAVPVRDAMVSAQTVLNYGEAARDLNGNPVPQLDANGKPIPQGVVGAQALLEITRTKDGVDGSQIYTSLQNATGNERTMFAKAAADGRVAEGATFSAAESTRESLQFIGRTSEQTSGSALEGARLITAEQKSADGRTFTISPDGSVVGGLNAIRQADSAPADQKTVMGGAQEIALFNNGGTGTVQRDAAGFPLPLSQQRPEQTFQAGAANTAAMADRTGSNGQPVESSQLFTQGISNVQAYSKDGTFSGGRDTVAFIGGGSDRPDAITRGVQEIRTAADTTTAGSVSQMAAVTSAAGGGDPRVGAESLMNYRGRESSADGSYSAGAKSLYTDLYGAPNSPTNAGQTLQPRDVERAVSLASPGTAEVSRLQSGMDKTNEIVRTSGNSDLTGAQVLQNLSNNQAAFEAVQKAPDAVAAREALVQQGTLQQITTPVALQKAEVAEKPEQVAQVQPSTTTQTKESTERSLGNVVVATAPASSTTVPKESADRQIERPATEQQRQSTTAQPTTIDRTADRVSPAVGTDLPVRPQQTQHLTDRQQTDRQQTDRQQTDRQQTTERTRELADRYREAAAAAIAAASAKAQLERTVSPTANQSFAPIQTSFLKAAFEKASSDKVSITNHAAATTSGTTPNSKPSTSSGFITNPSVSVKSVVASVADHVSRPVLQGNVNINVTAFAKSAAAAEAARTARGAEALNAKSGGLSGNINGVRTIADSANIGRIQPLRAGITGTGNTAANSARAMDMAIGRNFRGFGGNNNLDGSKELTLKGKMRKFKRWNGQDRELLGAEIALAALLISASIAKEAERKQEAARKKKSEGGELQKLADRLDEVNELNQDDSANIGAYRVLTRPTWLVRPNEDLVKLAEHLFHEAELGWLIADLNIGSTKETYLDGKRIVELRTRQRIDLPVWQDIVEFHKKMDAKAKPENLITIVTEAAVDQELMNATLGLAMGTTTSVAPPVSTVAAAVTIAVADSNAGLAPAAKELEKAPVLVAATASSKQAALSLRNAVDKPIEAKKNTNNDQGPTAGAAVTEADDLQPRYV